VFGRAHDCGGELEAYFPWGGIEHFPKSFEVLVDFSGHWQLLYILPEASSA